MGGRGFGLRHLWGGVRKAEIARLYEEKRARWRKQLAEERKLADDLARYELKQKFKTWWNS